MKIGIAAFSPTGRELLKRIVATQLEHSYLVFDPAMEPLPQWVGFAFRKARAIVFVGATGIAVRLIAPYVVSKEKDPAVLVIDELGKHVIPILSGHIGGANRLALEVSSALGAKAIISTATDISGVFAVDEWSAISGCTIPHLDSARQLTTALLAGKPVGFASDFPVEDPLPKGLNRNDFSLKSGICVTLNPSRKPFESTLHVVPKIGILGVGCRQHTDPEEFEKFILATLEKHDIFLHSLTAIASVDLKRDEQCLLRFAEKYELTTHFYSASDLSRAEGAFAYSSFVLQVAGVDNVCERAAVLCSDGGELIVPKNTGNGISVALARMRWAGSFEPLMLSLVERMKTVSD